MDTCKRKLFDKIIVPLCIIIFLVIILFEQSNKIALIIVSWCLGLQSMLLFEGIEELVKQHKKQ